MKEIYQISGKVINKQTEKGIPDLRIEAWDKDLVIDDLLGVATSDENGAFTIKFDEHYYQELCFDRRPDIYFKVFKETRLLVNTSDHILWNVKYNLDCIEIPIPNEVLGDDSSSAEFKITGRISSDKRVVAGIKVIAYDKRISGDVVIGNAVTDEKGNYTVIYSQKNLQDKAKPDIEIRLLDTGNNDKEIGRSTVKYNAGTIETLNVVVDSANVARASEYERLLADLRPHLENNKLQDLKEDDNREDISFLANKSGWDARLVAMVAQAEILSSQSKIKSTHYYALFRSGIAGNPESLSKLSAQYVEKVIKKAVIDKIIPDSADITETLKILKAQSAAFLLNNSSGTAVSTLNSMLDLQLLTPTQKKIFIESYQEFGNDTTGFWASLKTKGLSNDLISNLQLDGKLGYLTLQNAPLIKRLYEAHKISDPSDLVRAGLYKASNWKKLIGNDVPKDVKLDDYAGSLANQLVLSYPTLVTAEMLKNDELNLGKNSSKDELYSFLNASHSQYSLGIQPVKTWEGFDKLKPETRAAAKQVERIYQMSPSNEAMSTLSSLSLTSAYHIMKYTRDEFKIKYTAKFSTPKEADLVYTKAHEIYSSTMNLATAYLTSRMAPNVYSITGKLEKTQNEIIAYPTLEELFGDMDYCTCDHCRSVLSPAAYLVDLLQFIDLKDIPHEKTNPIEELLKRRPDIEHIQLTCENTNTVMPYLDLVNEILEYYIVNGNLTAFKGHNIGEEIKSNDLLADPQYVEDNAYVKTKGEVYPYNLPFDQPLEALRLLFQVWDTSLCDALDIFKTKLSARIELLGLNKEEYRILTDRTFHNLPEYFGEPAGATIDNLNSAIAGGKTFARRVDITYIELAEILKTQFINPGINLVPALKRLTVSLTQIQSLYDGSLSTPAFNGLLPVDLNLADYNGNVIQWLNDNRTLIMGLITLTDMAPGTGECSFANLQLRYALPDMTLNKLTAVSYHKLHRFIRIWKKEGWSLETLDKIITTLSPTLSKDITEVNMDGVFVTLLSRIANFKRLAALRSISEKKLPNWLAIWDASQTFAIRQEQFAKLVKMRLEDVIDLISIAGLDPLSNDLETDDPSLLQYLEIIDSLKSASLKIQDINYILRHKDESGKLTPVESSQLKNIKIIRDSINAITAELNLAPDNADFSYAKTKMTLVYDKTVVDTFFELLTNAKVFEAPLAMAEEILPSKLTDIDAAMGYEPFKKFLTYKGILTTAAQNALAAKVDTLTLADVVIITLQVDLDAFKTNFKNALQVLHNEGAAELTAFAASYPELKTIYDAVTTLTEPSEQIKALLDGILPELQGKLKVNAMRQALTDILKCGPEITEALTKNIEVLHSVSDISKGILEDFLRLEDNIVFASNKTYDFYIDAPATDNYLVYINAPQNTVVTLTVDSQKIIDAQTISASREIQNAAPILIKAGNLCPVQLIISSLPGSSTAELMWRTKGMAKTSIPLTKIYNKENVDKAKTSLIRLQKSSQLQRLLKMTARELSYFASENVETQDILNNLDTNGSITDPNLHNLWNKFYLLVYFTMLKNENEPEENTWVQILEKPDVLTPQGKSLILGANNWKDADLNSVLANMTYTKNDLSRLSIIKKVKRAMDIVILIDYPAADVINWATDSPSSSLIKDIKAKIRERCDDAAWLNTMQSVSDSLRNKSRDAAVTYILFHLRPSPEIDTADKLYEYFLVDVQMDACMKTSRIRLALSTVQLFIQRCLMNLEPDVATSSIRAQQWEWMKRYRVWEANRKVFLYPENWLEPELRDNKSPFFKELEGELLQADITDDLAELAFLNYLKKLDDVARLEIAGTYLQENEQGNQNDDILHVFGRTNGNTRQYYHRRYEYGYWTPWEKISINIEGDLIFPVMWKSRLFVFWLNIIEKPAGAGSASFQGMSDSTWTDNNKKNVGINMCWAEYYKGKWTSPKSSDLKNSIKIDGLMLSFNPKNILLYAKKEKMNKKASERLIFNLLYITSDAYKYSKITYTSKNAPPIVENGQKDDKLFNDVGVFNYNLFRKPYEGANPSTLNAACLSIPSKELRVSIDQPTQAESPTITETILTRSDKSIGEFNLLPIRHFTENQWEAPFFYNDEHSTFSVNPDEKYTTPIWAYEEYYDAVSIVTIHPEVEIEIPLLQEEEIVPDIKGPVINPWDEVTINVRNPNYKTTLPNSIKFAFDKATFDSGGKINAQAGNIGGNFR